MSIDLSGQGTATDFEIDSCAKEIFERITLFDSPKDAASALTIAQWYMMKATFPPECRAEAKDAIQATCDLLKSLVDDGWQ